MLGLAEIRRRSPVLEDLEKKGAIQITGAMYDLSTGKVEFVAWLDVDLHGKNRVPCAGYLKNDACF